MNDIITDADVEEFLALARIPVGNEGNFTGLVAEEIEKVKAKIFSPDKEGKMGLIRRR